MRSRRLYILVVMLLILITVVSGRDFVKVGTTGAQFLKVEVGARALGMAGCYSALANDALALYWNPAGIAGLHSFQATFTHTRWIAGIYTGFVGAVLPLNSISSFGFSVQYMTMDEMEQTTIEQPQGTGLMFGYLGTAVAMSYARAMTDYINVGITGKYVYEKIWNETASSLACDMGITLDTGIWGIKLAMVMSNFGTEMRLDGRDLIRGYDQVPESMINPDAETHLSPESWPLPTNLRVSLATNLIGINDYMLFRSNATRLTTVVDLTHPNDYYEQYNFGLEYAVKESYFFRAGYRSQSDEEGFTLGGGVRLSLFQGGYIDIDYAWAEFGIFDYVQHFTLSVKF